MAKRKMNRTTVRRQLFTLPPHLVEQIETYADICRGGNKSGFVADAVEAYINSLGHYRHAQKLRAAYTAAAHQSQLVAADFEHLDNEIWARLDQLEARTK
jgi:DNA-binding transcriptional MocR family regulator